MNILILAKGDLGHSIHQGEVILLQLELSRYFRGCQATLAVATTLVLCQATPLQDMQALKDRLFNFQGGLSAFPKSALPI